jgi:hypothetical protein
VISTNKSLSVVDATSGDELLSVDTGDCTTTDVLVKDGAVVKLGGHTYES